MRISGRKMASSAIVQPMKIVMGSRRSSRMSKSEVSVAAAIRPLFQSDMAMLTLNTAEFRVSGSRAIYWLKLSVTQAGRCVRSVFTIARSTVEMSLPVVVMRATVRMCCAPTIRGEAST